MALTPILPNEVEIYNRYRYIKDIWTGPNGTGRFVCREDDIVYDYTPSGSKIEYRVTYVDHNYIATLTTIAQSIPEIGITPPDAMLGDISDLPSVAHRCYIKTDVLPFAMSISVAVPVFSTEVTHYKVFLGWDISAETGVVISAQYNSSGQYVGENIPVVLLGTQIENNVGVKGPAPGHCTQDLPSGQVVTAVFYNSVGGEVYIQRLLVSNTNFIRSSEASKRLIVDIELISPWLSNNDDFTLDYPANVTLDTVQMIGRVHYTDGTVDYPVDGNRFRLDGAQGYIPTQVGQSIPVSLSYGLTPDEEVLSGLAVAGGRVMKPYRVRTTEVEGAYSLKLFGYPRWLNAIEGYTLDWWLYDLERKNRYLVSNLVEITTNSPPFNPTSYGVRQNLEVAINIQQVNPNYRNWRFIQEYSVTLVAAGNVSTPPNWRVHYGSGQGVVPYGDQLAARIQFVNANVSNLNIASNFTDQAAWVKAVYFDTFPLYNPLKEIAPPTPTHFTVEFKNNSYEYTLAEWNSVKQIINDYAQGELLRIHFYRQLAGERLLLCTSCMAVHLS